MLNVYRFSVLLPGPRDGSTISRFCAAFEIEFRRKSSRLCSSPAKYIWVVIMWKNTPYALKWRWGGRIYTHETGYAPGLIVLNENMPFSSVRICPMPRKFEALRAV